MVLHFTLAQLVSMAAGAGVPLAVAALAKLKAPRIVKSVLNVLLTCLAGALTTVTASADTTLGSYATDIGLAWFTSICTYYGFHKPTGTAGTVGIYTANFGFGRVAPEGAGPGNANIPPVPAGVAARHAGKVAA